MSRRIKNGGFVSLKDLYQVARKELKALNVPEVTPGRFLRAVAAWEAGLGRGAMHMYPLSSQK